MRFGQLEIKLIAAAVRERFRLERLPGHVLEIRQTPTLGPRGGLPMRIRAR
jgi:cytochrome P450